MKIRENIEKISAYSSGVSEKELKEKYGLEKIVKLNANENPYGTSEFLINQLSKITDVSRYPDQDAISLREKIAKKYNLKLDNIILGDGGDEIIELLCQIMLDKDDEIVMCVPGFSMYKIMSCMQDANVKQVPLKEFKTDLDSIIKNITNKTKIIFITNPHNPTGTIIKEKELREFLNKISKDILVVIDEAYAEFVDNKEFPNSLKLLNEYENVCILRTFSKAYGLAGLRVGYCLAKEELINEMNKIRPPYNVNVVSQKIAEFALEDETWINECIEKNSFVVKKLCNKLKELNINYVEPSANFIFIDTKMDSNYVYEELLKKGFMVRAGYSKPMETYMRVSMGTEEQMDEFIKVLKDILEKG